VHHFQVDKREAVTWMGFLRLELCAATREGCLIFWDLVKRRRIQALAPLALSEITSVCVIPNSNSRYIVLGQLDGKVCFYDSIKKRPCSLFIPVLTNVGSLDSSSVVCAEFCPTHCNKLLISYNTEPSIYLYNFVEREINITSKKELSKYRVSSICRCLALSKDHSVFVAGCDDGKICVFRFDDLDPVKTILLNSNPALTPVYEVGLHEMTYAKSSAPKSVYVSGGWSFAEKTSGVVRLDISIPSKGEVEQRSSFTVKPSSGRTSDFCLKRKPMSESKDQDYTELIIQNVQGDVQLFATQYSQHDSDEEESKSGETRHCSLFHTELKDVVDMSLCSGSSEEWMEFCPFEPTTPLSLLGGESLFEYECDYLATGHKSGLCILWKLTRREYFSKILEVDIAQLLVARTGEKDDGCISAINLSGRMITVGTETGDVVEIKLTGVQKDGTKILWESKIQRKVHNKAVMYIRRSQNALVIVDKSSLTSVHRLNGKLSVFAALDGFDADENVRITWVSIQPSVVMDMSVIYFGFSNGVWGLYNFKGNRNSLGPLADNKFESAVVYIARLNHKGQLSKCKPSTLLLRGENSAEKNGGTVASPCSDISLHKISADIVRESSYKSAPVLKVVVEKGNEKDDNPRIDLLKSDGSKLKSNTNHMAALTLSKPKYRRVKSHDSFLHEVRNQYSDCESAIESAPETPTGRRSSKPKSKNPFKKFSKRNVSEPVTFWTLETGVVAQDWESLKGQSSDAKSSPLKPTQTADLPESKENYSAKKQEHLVETVLPEQTMTPKVKREASLERHNELEENSIDERDNYLVICSRKKAVVIQIALPSLKICARYSFQSPLLGAQVISREPGKVGLATISENGRCNIFRLMDMHVLQSTDMKIPNLMNMAMLQTGRYVGVSSGMEFYHGGFFETPVKLSFFVQPTSLQDENETEAHPRVHKQERSGLFSSLFSSKPKIIIDSWDDALKALDDPLSSARGNKSPPKRAAPKAKHRQNASEPLLKRKSPRSGQRTFLGGNENLEKMNERGEKIAMLGDKSAEMSQNAANFADLAKQLRKKNQSWW